MVQFPREVAQPKTNSVLIVTGETGQLQYYRQVGPRLIKRGFSISFCCDRDDVGVAKAVREVAEECGAHFIHHRGDSGPPEQSWSTLDSISHIFGRICASVRRRLRIGGVPGEFDKVTGAPLALLNAMRRYHAYRLHDAQRVLTETKPDIVVIGEDGIAADFWLITRAKNCGIPVAILPYGMADSSSLIWKGLEQKSYEESIFTIESAGAKFINDNFPRWFKNTRFGKTLYFAPAYIIALEEAGIKILDPWCFQGGVGDLILLEGAEMKERYLLEGVSMQKMVEVGAIYADVIHHVFKSDQRYMRAYANNSPIDSKRMSALVCVPSSEVKSWRASREFYSLGEYLNALRRACEDLNVELTYSFHPRMSQNDRSALTEAGFVPSDEFVVSLIAKHDLVITCHSSVTRWALMAQKPVVDFDLQCFGSNFFPDCDGFAFCPEFADVVEVLDLVTSDRTAYELMSRACESSGSRLGSIDGRAADRVALALRLMIAGSGGKQIADAVRNFDG